MDACCCLDHGRQFVTRELEEPACLSLNILMPSQRIDSMGLLPPPSALPFILFLPALLCLGIVLALSCRPSIPQGL